MHLYMYVRTYVCMYIRTFFRSVESHLQSLLPASPHCEEAREERTAAILRTLVLIVQVLAMYVRTCRSHINYRYRTRPKKVSIR